MRARRNRPLNPSWLWRWKPGLRRPVPLAGRVAGAVFLLSACVSYALVHGVRSGDPEASPVYAMQDEPPPVEAVVSAEAGPGPPPSALVRPEVSARPDSNGGPAGHLRVVTGRLPPDGTVAVALRAEGFSRRTVYEIDRSIRAVFNFRYAHEGDFFSVIEDKAGELISFEFHRGRRDVYRVERGADGELHASHVEVPLERRVVQLGGVINRSLFDSLTDLGERPDLVNDFADVFVWDFDFSSQTRPGDEFRLVFEKFYDREGFVRYGTILAARYLASSAEFTAIYFEDADGYGDYYTPEGNSVRRTFLRAPVKYSRISSRYSKSRLHPILKVKRPHLAIDYVAATGTPIWAVADGEIIFRGWSGGLGRTIKVRHNNGYVSYYGHLSRYEPALRVGTRVRQKQVIGYVGRSGLATAPHVDYRLKIRGRFVDPLKVRFPKGTPISVVGREGFSRTKSIRLAELTGANPPLVLEAGM